MPRLSMFRRATVPVAATLFLGALVLSLDAAQNAAALKNPIPSTPASIAAGKKAYDENCAACHGPKAEGSVKAGVIINAARAALSGQSVGPSAFAVFAAVGRERAIARLKAAQC